MYSFHGKARHSAVIPWSSPYPFLAALLTTMLLLKPLLILLFICSGATKEKSVRHKKYYDELTDNYNHGGNHNGNGGHGGHGDYYKVTTYRPDNPHTTTDIHDIIPGQPDPHENPNGKIDGKALGLLLYEIKTIVTKTQTAVSKLGSAPSSEIGKKLQEVIDTINVQSIRNAKELRDFQEQQSSKLDAIISRLGGADADADGDRDGRGGRGSRKGGGSAKSIVDGQEEIKKNNKTILILTAVALAFAVIAAILGVIAVVLIVLFRPVGKKDEGVGKAVKTKGPKQKAGKLNRNVSSQSVKSAQSAQSKQSFGGAKRKPSAQSNQSLSAKQF